MRGDDGVAFRRGGCGTDPDDIVPGAAFGAEGADVGRRAALGRRRKERHLFETAGEPEGGLDRSGRFGGPAGADGIGEELDALTERSLGQEPFGEAVSEVTRLSRAHCRTDKQGQGQEI